MPIHHGTAWTSLINTSERRLWTTSPVYGQRTTNNVHYHIKRKTKQYSGIFFFLQNKHNPHCVTWARKQLNIQYYVVWTWPSDDCHLFLFLQRSAKWAVFEDKWLANTLKTCYGMKTQKLPKCTSVKKSTLRWC